MLDKPTPYTDENAGTLIHYYRDIEVDVYYDVPTLWELSKDLPRFNLTAAHFNEFLIRESAWESRAPIAVGHTDEHWERILDADNSHPVMVRFKSGKMLMVDGFHRVTRAYLDGLTTLAAVDVSDLLIQARIRGDYVWPEGHD